MAVDDAFTKSLLHLNGADASTTITDESGKTWTAGGNAQIDTSQSVFGGASLLLDGTGDYISTPDSDDFYFGTGDFTIDFRIRFNSLTNTQRIYTQRADTNNRILFLKVDSASGNKLQFRSFVGGATRASYDMTSNWTASTNTWYHLALVRNGTNLYIFIDGTSQTLTVNTAISTNDVGNIGASVFIGQEDVLGNPVNGWIDEVRVSKGIARWTANFTPPAAEYSGFSPSVILW